MTSFSLKTNELILLLDILKEKARQCEIDYMRLKDANETSEMYSVGSKLGEIRKLVKKLKKFAEKNMNIFPEIEDKFNLK